MFPIRAIHQIKIRREDLHLRLAEVGARLPGTTTVAIEMGSLGQSYLTCHSRRAGSRTV